MYLYYLVHLLRAAGAEIWAHELAAQWMEANTNPDMVAVLIILLDVLILIMIIIVVMKI